MPEGFDYLVPRVHLFDVAVKLCQSFLLACEVLLERSKLQR